MKSLKNKQDDYTMKETSLHAINSIKRIEEILLKSFLKSHPLG